MAVSPYQAVMDADDPLPSIEQETPPDLLSHKVSTNSEPPMQSAQEDGFAITPPRSSSPAPSSYLTPRLHREISSPQPRFSNQRPSTSQPSRPERRTSTPLQPRASQPAAVRRISSNLHLRPSVSSTHSRSPSGTTSKDMERKPVVTAATVAQDHFRKDLDAHENLKISPQTVVIIRDSCYGHRYSRPRTSKAALSTIVERPERLHACILGASAAYVRTGGRHAGGRCPPSTDDQEMLSPPFKIQKTNRSVQLNYSAVTQVHGQKWMEELQIMCDSAEVKLAMNGRELVRPVGYGKDEAGSPLPKLHEGDLYLCSESLDALQGCLGGVCEAVDTVLGPSGTNRAFVCIRPPGHHCSSNFPSGFCWLNNVHVGIAHAAMTQGLTHAAIIDFDLHHGDGSQAIAWDHNRKAAGNLGKTSSPYSRTPIGYFSLHDINSYPCEWGDEEKIKNASLCIENAHGQSIWNVHLEPWKTHDEFWKLYESRYSVLLEKTRIFLRHHTTRLNSIQHGPRAKAAIFLSAGFDASEWEGAGMQRHKVNVPTDFYARLTSDVVRLAEEEGLGAEGRVLSVLEGGYSDRALTSGVLSHLCGLTTAAIRPSPESENLDSSLASAMAKQIGVIDASNLIKGEKDGSGSEPKSTLDYDPEWWKPSYLEALEALVNPYPVPIAPAKPKEKLAGNYSSPTQASTAKMAEAARERRSMSGQLEARMSVESEPVLPPPEVDWAVAAYELSQLLIPTDRQTLSCRHDELNAEATKVRRERQSAIGLPANNGAATSDERMQLRDRKAKAPVVNESVNGVLKADRRRTIAAVGDLPDPGAMQSGVKTAGVGIANTRPRRRSSAGSSILSAFESMNLSDRSSQPPEARLLTSGGKAVPNGRATRPPTGAAQPIKAPVQRKSKQPTVAKASSTNPKTNARKSGPESPAFETAAPFLHTIDDLLKGGQEVENQQAQPAASPVEPVYSAINPSDDLDALSSGMKKMKIHLKVPSAEENAKRQEKKAAEKKERNTKKARAPRKAPIPKSAKAAAPTKKAASDVKDSSMSSSQDPSPKAQGVMDVGKAKPIDHVTPVVQSEQAEQQQVLESMMEPSVSADDYTLTAGGVATAEPPVPAIIAAPVPAPLEVERTALPGPPFQDTRLMSGTTEPDAGFASEAEAEAGLFALPLPPRHDDRDTSERPLSAEAMVATTATASAPTTEAPRKTRADLPHFTASSPIPFAKNQLSPFPRPVPVPARSSEVSSPEDAARGQERGSLEEIIDPGRRTGGIEDARPGVQEDESSTTDTTARDASVWDVPVTPRH